MSILSSVALGFFGRKLLDVGGWLGGVISAGLTFYAVASPAQQQVISDLLTGKWQDITLGALIPFIIWAWGQFMQFRATVKPQLVTPAGKKVELDQLPVSAQQDVLVTASKAQPKRTIANVIMEALARKRG